MLKAGLNPASAQFLRLGKIRLIEELFGLLDRLARMEKISHESKEWRERR